MAIDENSGCIDLFYAFTLRITFFLIHIYTIVTAFKIGGSLLGIITIPLPVISQIYWFIRIAISSGTIFNLYCVIIFIYLAFCISYILNLMVKSYEGRPTPLYIYTIVVVVILALTIFIGYAVSNIKTPSEALYNKGFDLAKLGRYDEALESFNKAIEIKPDYYEAWCFRGAALYELGRYKEAIESFNKALEINPDYPKAWYVKGVALNFLDWHDEALDCFNKAIKLNPDDHVAWFGKGVALLDLGRYKEALKAFNKAIEIKSDYHEAWLGKGVALKKLGRKNEAQKAFEKENEIKKKRMK